MKQTNFKELNYFNNRSMSFKLQPIAIDFVYSKLWPDGTIVELDIDVKNKLAQMIDIGGADKMIKFKSGGIAFLAQRFRDWEHRNKNDFTIRDSELHKVINAFNNSGFIASYYAYGYSNSLQNGFYKFRIFKYKEAIEYILANKLYRGWIPNIDGTRFVAIPFDKFPKNLFLFYEDQYKQTNLFE